MTPASCLWGTASRVYDPHGTGKGLRAGLAQEDVCAVDIRFKDKFHADFGFNLTLGRGPAIRLLEKMRNLVYFFYIESWELLFTSLIGGRVAA